MEDPTPLDRYLGCLHRLKVDGDVVATTIDMSAYFTSKVKIFEEERPVDVKKVESPSVDKLPQVQQDLALTTPGVYADSCSSHLMALLYGCRMAGPALSVAIMRLTRFVTKWTQEQDRCLVRLYSWLKHHPTWMLTGELSSQDWAIVVLRSWPDSDLNGDWMTSKSTAGLFIELAGAEGRGFPLAWSCKTGHSTAEHTQEAETIALAHSTKYEALPLQQLVSKLIGRPIALEVMEDNNAAITAAEKGYSPSLRHLVRTERTSIGAVHELFFWNEQDDEEIENLRFWGHLAGSDAEKLSLIHI